MQPDCPDSCTVRNSFEVRPWRSADTVIIGLESERAKKLLPMPAQPMRAVSVIIPTWKRQDLLRRSLESLRRQTFSDFDTVIVSNGAGDWAESLAQEFGARVVRFAENRGFAAAINAGIAASQSPLVLLLNDDAELDATWLEKTTTFLQGNSDSAFCCGKIFQEDGHTIDNAGDALSMAGAGWRLGYGRPDSPEFNRPRLLFAVSMTAALFRREVFDRIGMLDEDFVSYLEDADFSIRLWRAGLQGMYLPQAKARHHGGASSGGAEAALAFRLLTRNRQAILMKHYPVGTLYRLLPRMWCADALWMGMAIRKGLFGTWLSGAFGFFLMYPRFLRKRFRAWPRNGRAFRAWLRESERAIYEDISARPPKRQDTYWRMYFGLFRPGLVTASSTSSQLAALPSTTKQEEKTGPSRSLP